MKFSIKRYRYKHKLTQKQLGRLINKSDSYVSLVENNKTDPRSSTLEKLGCHLEVCPKEMIIGCNNLKCSMCCYNKDNIKKGKK
jgi:predicted transcriptional regulator